VWERVAVGFFFGCVASLGVVLGRAACKNIVPFEDGPRQGRPPVPVLIIASVLLGALVSGRGVSWISLTATAVVVLALVAAWVSDVLCGILPDAFTLLPLAGIVGVRAFSHQWDFLLGGAFVFLPFALVAACSKGLGLGWGDVKLATLGGVLLGAYAAIWSFIAVSLLVVVVAWARGRRSEPIAFGPYLAGAIGVTLAALGPNI
jgi:hypothetical protein